MTNFDFELVDAGSGEAWATLLHFTGASGNLDTAPQAIGNVALRFRGDDGAWRITAHILTAAGS